jgi:ribosomal protein S18 acetylase RimI-like enzyme
VTVTLGALTLADVRPLARLHRAAFPGFFLSSLGEPFLVQFYRGFLIDDSAVSVVARGPDGSVRGAVVGTAQPADFFGRLVRNRWPWFVLASARVVALNPRAAPRLVRAVRYRGDTPTGCRGALLSSLCVAPSLQGAGVGRQLVEAWTREVAGRGVDTAFLTTDADDNSAVNRFYQAQGWVLSHAYVTREGRLMNRYTKRLDAC